MLDPSMPIVAGLDTLGVANRLFIEGTTLYVTDMAGDGQVSQLNVISLADPYHPRLLRTVALLPARPDFVADGVYDAYVSGGKAYVSVHYSNQEDTPAQSVVEIIDLAALERPELDATVPVVTHRVATGEDFAARGLLVARGSLQIAAGRQGILEVGHAALERALAHPACVGSERLDRSAVDRDRNVLGSAARDEPRATSSGCRASIRRSART